MESPVEEINKAVNAAFAAEGYVKANGNGEVRDNRAMHHAILSVVRQYKVASKKDRYTDAITRGKLIAAVFPNLPGPDAWENEDDPVLALEVYKKVSAAVWGAVAPASTSPVQKLVRLHESGMTLIRVTLYDQEDPMDVVYLTDDLGCLRQDYEGPLRTKLTKLANDSARDHVALIETHPEHATKIAADYRTQSRKAVTASNDTVQLALDIVTGNGDGDE
jgi:hypothetical protein